MKIKLIISLIATLFITVGSSYTMDAVNDTKEEINTLKQFPGEKIASLDYKNGKLLIYTQNINQDMREVTDSKVNVCDYKQNNLTISNEWNPKKYAQSFPYAARFIRERENQITLYYSKYLSIHTYDNSSIQKKEETVLQAKFNPLYASSEKNIAQANNCSYILFDNKIRFPGHKLNDKLLPIYAIDFNETGELLAVAFANGVKIYKVKTIEKIEPKKNTDYNISSCYSFFSDEISPTAIKFGPNKELFVGDSSGNIHLIQLQLEDELPSETNLLSEEQHQVILRQQLKEIKKDLDKVEEQANNGKKEISEHLTQLKAEKKKLDDQHQRSVFNKLRQWAHGAYQNPLRTLIAAGVVTTTLYFAIKMALARI